MMQKGIKNDGVCFAHIHRREFESPLRRWDQNTITNQLEGYCYYTMVTGPSSRSLMKGITKQ